MKLKSYHRFYLFAIMGFILCYFIISNLLNFGLVTYALGAYFHNWVMIIPLCLLLFWSCLCLYLGLMKAEIIYEEN